MLAPTLVASRTALPPEGAELAWGGPALRSLAPTLVASRTALPPREGRCACGLAKPVPRPLLELEPRARHLAVRWISE